MSFLAISARSRYRVSAFWFAGAFAAVSLAAICEFLVAYLPLAKLWAIAAFATLLGGMFMLRIGLGHLYGAKTNKPMLAALYLAFIGLDLAIYDLPRGTFAHALPYQAPFAFVLAMSAVAVWRSRLAGLADRLLVVLLAATGVYFLAKVWVAVLAGAGETARDYLGSQFALVSQSTGAVLLVILGLTLLCVLVLEIVAHEKGNAEVDRLSGLFNRRGFEDRVEGLVAMPGPHSLVLCDLDRFKSVNDTYGHQGGDDAIRAFANTLRAVVPRDALVARIGGEEFALFLPKVDIGSAVLLAQALRATQALTPVPGLSADLRVTASFGVTAVGQGEPMRSAMRRADDALYAAKNAGRDRVRVAELPEVETIGVVRLKRADRA